MTLDLRPITKHAANDYIRANHRHHGQVRGLFFGLSAWRSGELVGVAIVGRPVARMLWDGVSAEVTRCCTDGSKNVPSFLYGAARRAARAIGYRQLYTYTLASESGVSLIAAGWIRDADVKGQSWNRASRPRADVSPTCDKVRWRAFK